MEHQSVREKLLLYKDAENIDPQDEIFRHLEGCEECRAFQSRLEKIQNRLSSVSLKPSPAFVYKVMDRLEKEHAAKPAKASSRPALKWLFPTLGYAFAIVLMFEVILHQEIPVTTESVLLSDIPQEAQWSFVAQSPDTENLLGQ